MTKRRTLPLKKRQRDNSECRMTRYLSSPGPHKAGPYDPAPPDPNALPVRPAHHVGADFLAPDISAALRDKWEEICDDVMDRYAAERPFERPWGHWTFDLDLEQFGNPVQWLLEHPDMLTPLERQILGDPSAVKPEAVAHLGAGDCRLLNVPHTRRWYHGMNWRKLGAEINKRLAAKRAAEQAS